MTIEEQLSKISNSNVKLANGLTLQQQLENAVQDLYQCIQNRIDEYYAHRYPRFYKRTFDFQDSLFAENLINARVVGNRIELSLSFDDSLAFHKSLTGQQSYVPILINYGWAHNGYENEPDDYFHKYSGYHFIEKGIADFNRTNTYGVTIDVSAIWRGQIIK